MRVLGIDPGLTRCGVAVVDGRLGRMPTLVAVDAITTRSSEPTPRRLLHIETQLERWVSEYRPEVVAIERVFADQNVLSVIGTAQAAGLGMLVAARHGLEVFQHTPTEVKASITGSGRADKAQVGQMVARILRLDSPPKPADAADAAALAVCHLWRHGGQSRLQEAVAKQAELARAQRRRRSA